MTFEGKEGTKEQLGKRYVMPHNAIPLATALNHHVHKPPYRYPMRLSITITVQPDPVRPCSSTMKSALEHEDCQVLHGLQHRSSASGGIVVDDQEEDPAVGAAAAGHTEEGTQSFERPTPARGTVERFIAERKSRRAWMSPGLLRQIIQLVSVASSCALLIPYMHRSRMKMSVQCETCKANALVEYENNLTQCETIAGANFNPRGGTVGLNWREVFTIMCLSCAWQYLTWLFQDTLCTRIFSPSREKMD
ncbi:uncharacterized protein A1O9_10830 [Exophiala aquamarina CBS 119918]|uniref:Uncharacterized protein n=1 Tax=Exophiala aquamarina CBS 119918 TaxID=1182545 RepID=A0A072NYI5_9EURO|nr:uncharacterized protein A1O9_10830 [Exophiala aquamarina CBS 119918]KEF52924.1 hypothetical protein A1O9_10830 [Exophiala aquamarina CBS 119918]